jgi:hypothetical protein
MAENCQSCAKLRANRQALREALGMAQPIVVEYLRDVVNGSNQRAAMLAVRTLAAIRDAWDRSEGVVAESGHEGKAGGQDGR